MVLGTNGLLVCGNVGAPDLDAWLMRTNFEEGMPEWVKNYIRTGTDDELSGVFALPDGLVAFGRTEIAESRKSDLWILRTNVDGMLHFTSDSGLTTVNTAVDWQRIHDHTIRELAPKSLAASLEFDPDANLLVDPASALGELVTE